VIQTQGGFLISQIKQVQGRVFEHLLQQAELDNFNGPQGRILYVLWQEDGLPIVEVSKRTGLAKTTLTGMLDRMEGLGLLARLHDEDDRRQQRIVLTEKAKTLSGKYEAVSQRMAELFYQGFEESEILAFEMTLQKILANLEEAEEASKKKNGAI
jgi:MarR family transcriptional regulator, organic hydroperoxide resistance regulator